MRTSTAAILLLILGCGAAASAAVLPDDRRIDWSLAGIPGGIPARTIVFETIDAATYGNGSTDATTAIQQAIDTCPSDQVVVLPAGTYVTSDTIHLRSRRTLRGAGSSRTIIRYQGTGGRSVLDLRGLFNWDVTGLKRTTAVTGGGTKGSRQITVASAAGMAVGDVLLIDQLNDGVLVDNVGNEGVCTWCSRENGARARGQVVEITAISGNAVSLNLPLFFALNASLTPQATLVSAASMVRDAGVEALALTQAQAVNEFIIEMDGAQRCWLRDVDASRMDRRGLWHIESLQDEIRDCRFHDALNGYGRDHGYAIQIDLQSTANLIENNILQAVDGGGLMTSGGAIGNVFGYNYLPDIRFDDSWWMIAGPSPNHSAHPSMNLWEGNIGPQIGADFIHGSSSHQVFFRCRSFGWKDATATSNNNAIDFEYRNTSMSVLGCVLGTSGKSDTYEAAVPAGGSYELKPIWRLGYGGPGGAGDPNVKATLLRHGNWDAVSNGVVWDPAITDHALPASLYRTTKPAWWGDLPWPAIGPDVPGLAGKIPAQVRAEGGGGTTTGGTTTGGTTTGGTTTGGTTTGGTTTGSGGGTGGTTSHGHGGCGSGGGGSALGIGLACAVWLRRRDRG